MEGSRPNSWIAVNGVRVDAITHPILLSSIDRFLKKGETSVVQFLAADPTVLARSDPSYRDVLNAGDLNVPDGQPVAWAMRLQGCGTERLPGTDAMTLLIEWGLKRQLRHYFFGSTEQVVTQLGRRLKGANPLVQIAGAEAPPFRPLQDDELAHVAARVRESRADLLWLGLGTPAQHLVAHRLREHRPAPVILCVGAAFEFLAGTKRRAPRWMQRTGLEWLHRLLNEPKRLWKRYLLGNPRFILGIVRDLRLRRQA
jgi:N-acetylglucosaminyldiphosphoundecaprenol N-acetyl-beta-D-mannosaminyltransferase